MITTEGPYKPRSGLGEEVITLGNGGKIRKTGQPASWKNADDTADKQSKLVANYSYNVGFGSTIIKLNSFYLHFIAIFNIEIMKYIVYFWVIFQGSNP